MKLINIQDEELFQECIVLFIDKLNIIIPIIIGLIVITTGITAYYKEQPLVNFLINILVVLGICFYTLAALLLILYKDKLKTQEKLDEERKSNSFHVFGVDSLFRNRYKKW